MEVFYCGKTASELVVFLMLIVGIQTWKTSCKHCINPLGKTKENALENKVFTGVFQEHENNGFASCFLGVHLAAWLAQLVERQSAVREFEPQTGPTLRVLK